LIINSKIKLIDENSTKINVFSTSRRKEMIQERLSPQTKSLSTREYQRERGETSLFFFIPIISH